MREPSIYGLLVEANAANERQKMDVLMIYQAALGQVRLKVDRTTVNPSDRFSNPRLDWLSSDT